MSARKSRSSSTRRSRSAIAQPAGADSRAPAAIVLHLEGAQCDQVFAVADRYQPALRRPVFSRHDGHAALRGILQGGTYDAAWG